MSRVPNTIMNRTARQIQRDYNDALEQMVKKTNTFWNRARDVESGKIAVPSGLKTQEQIDGWKQSYITRAMKQTKAMEIMAEEMRGAGMTVRKRISGSMNRIYGYENKATINKLNKIHASGISAMNQNQINAAVKRAQTAFDKIALRNLTNADKIAAQLLREFKAMVSKNATSAQMVERIGQITGKKDYEARRILQTEKTRIEGAAMQDAAEEWQNATGRTAWKRWHCCFVKHSRDTHKEMHGQTVPIDEPFQSSSGAEFMFPGDDSLGAPAGEIVNCLCWMEIVEAEDAL